MTNLPFLSGLIASTLHVVSGPDHLAAVTPLAIETRRKVWRIGLLWGIGHLTGMLLIGMLFLLFKEYIPLEQISAYSEQMVGVTLILIGFWALISILRKNKTHKHPHIHDGDEPYIHVHSHEHDESRLVHDHSHSSNVKQKLWSSYAIGVLHGLAGIAHFILLLPVLGFQSQTESFQYILGFGIGTVFAMTIYTLLLGQLAMYSKNQNNKSLFTTIRVSGGLFAVVVGIFWIYLSF